MRLIKEKKSFKCIWLVNVVVNDGNREHYDYNTFKIIRSNIDTENSLLVLIAV